MITKQQRRRILLSGCQYILYPYRKDTLDSNGDTSKKSEFRVSVCGRITANGKKVSVIRNGDKVKMLGLVKCGHLQACPICYAADMFYRKQQIKHLYDWVDNAGGSCVIVTYTVSHERSDQLESLLAKFKLAKRSLLRSGSYNRIRNNLGCLGSCASTEVSFSTKNGWHPYQHDLWFFNSKDVDKEKLASTIFQLWQSACSRAGLETLEFSVDESSRVGVKVSHIESADTYINKIDRERVWSSQADKKPRQEPLITPWTMLENAVQESRGSEAEKLWISFLRGVFGTDLFSMKGASELCKKTGIQANLDEFINEYCKQFSDNNEDDSLEISQERLNILNKQGKMADFLAAIKDGVEVDDFFAKFLAV